MKYSSKIHNEIDNTVTKLSQMTIESTKEIENTNIDVIDNAIDNDIRMILKDTESAQRQS